MAGAGNRARGRPPARVFLGLTEIAGYYRDLRAGFQELGVTADVVTIFPHAFGYEIDDQADVARMLAFVRRAFPVRPARRTPAVIGREALVRLVLLAWAVPRYDTFIFGFRNTFLNGWDLPLLRLLGKRVVCVFHGSDSRPAYIDRINGTDLDGAAKAAWVRRRRRVVRRLERWSHEVVVGALTTQLHARPVVSFQTVGVPVPPRQPAEVPVSHVRATGEPYRVVHAPSHLPTKGTDVIRATIAELRDEGVPIEYRELIGVPNDGVLAALADADLLVDQLYSDTFLGGLGAEAAWCGCPAVVAGYELDLLGRLVDDESRPPGFYCRPDELTATVRRVLAADEERAAVGAAVQRWVQDRWSAAAVAGRFLQLCRGDVPAGWRLRPESIPATHGCGLDEATIRTWVTDVVAAAGEAGLGLDDKPALRSAFLRSFGP